MGLYRFKEFLDFDDIIDYFRDLKVYNAPLGYSEHARNRIKNILLELIQTGKLTPVFYYDGEFIELNLFDVGASDDDVSKIDTKRYFKVVSNELITVVFNDDFLPHSINNDDCDCYQPNIIDTIMSKPMLAKYYIDDKNFLLSFSKIIYPKSELDTIFNPTQSTTATATLQTQLDQANARIAELEQRLQGNQSENPLFVLGAIMHTIKQMSKFNYTQASHYQFIMDNYGGTGLSQSNFEKTINNAKKLFLQKANKKS